MALFVRLGSSANRHKTWLGLSIYLPKDGFDERIQSPSHRSAGGIPIDSFGYRFDPAWANVPQREKPIGFLHLFL